MPKFKDLGGRNHRFLNSKSKFPSQKWTVDQEPLTSDDNAKWQGFKLEGANGAKVLITQDEMDDLVGLGLVSYTNKTFDYPTAGVTFKIVKGLIKK